MRAIFKGIQNLPHRLSKYLLLLGPKNEKTNQLVPQPPSKLLCHAMSMHPPASASAATTLSNEELTLLLHHELNSSPRVPRVPLTRQASCIQLTSQIAPSMLSKSSSHSGEKDQTGYIVNHPVRQIVLPRRIHGIGHLIK